MWYEVEEECGGSEQFEAESDAEAIDQDVMGDAGCGDDPDDHDWYDWVATCEVENPGVWSLGGTTIEIREHCSRCGLRRVERRLGPQRNPGEADSVEYEAPRSERDWEV